MAGEDQNTLTSLAPNPMTTESPTLPTTELPTTAVPAIPGTLNIGPGDRVGNALAAMFGYATQNPVLQKQAAERQNTISNLEFTAAANAAVMKSLDLVAKGDTDGAREVLKSNPAAMFSPQGMALYSKTAEMDRAISLHKNSVAVLQSREDIPSQLAASYLASDPSMSTEKAVGLALETLKSNKAEKTDDGIRIIDTNTGKLVAFIPTPKIMQKKREEAIVSVGGTPGAEGAVKTLAPEQLPIDWFDKLDAPVKEALMATPGFDKHRYDMLAKAVADGTDDVDTNKELNAWNRLGSIQAGIKKSPMEWQIAGARLGLKPDEMLNPTQMSPGKATAWQNAVQNAKVEQEVKTAKGIHEFKVADMFAPDAFPSSRGLEMVNKATFESEPASAVHGDVFKQRMESGKWAMASPLDVRAAKYANAAISGVEAAQKLVNRMYHDLGPGKQDLRLDDAWRQWTAQYTASSDDTAAYRAIKVSLATEVAKALSPSARGTDAQRREVEHILPGGIRLETLGTAKASLDVIRGELNNRRLTAIGQMPQEIPLPQHIETKKGSDGKLYFRADGGAWALKEGQ